MVNPTEAPDVLSVRFGATPLSVPDATDWLTAVLDEARSAPPGDGIVLEVDGSASDARAGASVGEWTRWGKAVRRLERVGLPTVAAVSGPVDGLAFQLVLTVDFVVARPDTVLACSDLHHNALPDMAVFRLAKVIGLGRAKSLLFLDHPMSAAEALRVGLVTQVSDEPGAAAVELLGRGPSTRTAAWSLARRLLLESYATTFEDGHGSVLAAQERLLREAEAPR